MTFNSHLHSQLAMLDMLEQEAVFQKQPFFMCQHTQLRGSIERAVCIQPLTL